MAGICRMKHPSIPEEHRMNQSFTVTGMSCGHCEKAITQAIRQVDPQAEVRIDRSHNLVEVQSEQARETLSRAITDEGYAVAA
jgi:copper chaperone